MHPEARFHSTIVALVVPIMYFSLRALLPHIPPAGASMTFGQSAIALLASLGVYRVLAQIFMAVFRHVPVVKRWILGPYYIEGTWVGYYIGSSGDLGYVVETVEQDLSTLVLKGASYSADGNLLARWETNSATVDPIKGTLTYSHTCDVIGVAVPHQGIGVFDLRRPSAKAPADEIEGYSADLTHGRRAQSHEKKISHQGIMKAKALPEAIKFAAARLTAGKAAGVSTSKPKVAELANEIGQIESV